ncbi:hypothetical protein BS47DRAFT_1321320 [Hydnum rufescens UP504]|uniref:Aquaporin-like protein n=1 Tax=Hydnum rufescens UP504 TaxID=1448309 RepID=A0A9P6DQG4_9AGAM|nr:hypothetical protein BS47DRAFT_1321320 [Hydnum rufescens UP504]
MSGQKNDPGAGELNSRVISSYLHLVDVTPRYGWLRAWEHWRPLWVQEAFGEFLGVFFYCYAGIGATAAMNIGVLTNQPEFGNLLQVGFGYAMGIAFAFTICGMGGSHLNPAVTLAFALWRGFPWSKVPHYVAFQLLGGYVASLLVYAQYRPYILPLEQGLIQAGKSAEIFSALGTAGILAIYPSPGIPLRWVLLNEFVVDIFIGFVIWAVLDPSNLLVAPTTIAPLIGLAYGTMVWGFAPATIATNTARDLGARFAAVSIWGTEAWGGHYPAISAFTSLLSTLVAVMLYELFISDKSRVVTAAFREQFGNMDKHREHKAYQSNARAEQLRSRGASFGFGGDKQEISENEKSATTV